MYYVISNSDGDTRIDILSDSDLKERLNEKYYGNVGFMTPSQLKNTNCDPNCWGENILIIKGEIVIPQPICKVTEYKL